VNALPESADYLNALIMRTVQETNILPVSSACNVSCVFCSHHQNPPGVLAYRMPPRSVAEILDLAQWLDPQQTVVIGESATRIIEGEPLLHPEIAAILTVLRRRMPHTPLQITTNGSLLTAEIGRLLDSVRPVTVYLSLNSSDLENRRLLMRDPEPARALRGLGLLGAAGIPFEGSIVAMPELTGWEDLRQTIADLARAGTRMVRVFTPGFTRLAPDNLRFSVDFAQKLAAYLNQECRNLGVPVVLEPPLLTDLTPEVRGVISGSPGHTAGIRATDVIRRVNGCEPYSRVDAHQQLLQAQSPEVLLLRGGAEKTISLDKRTGLSAGLVFDYDFDPHQAEALKHSIRRGVGQGLVVTGTLAGALMARVLEQDIEEGHCRVLPIENRFFGGSIGCAGLLVVDDMLDALKQDRSANPNKVKRVLLPQKAFDYRGLDLTGRHYREIADALDLEVRLL
ncbi:MAG: DUF512 domain-containing protein, partial [Eubacteriales bacterium]|jgi:hypothetical protein|nr:DUF512 domain-containing protein [Eubacteriales bacterium]